MSKQKSYVITDAADAMAAELADANGLGKSNVIEILIRQAHAGSWAVVGNQIPSILPTTEPIYLISLMLSARTRNVLANAQKRGPDNNGEWIDAQLNTLQDVANIGVSFLMKQRNLGRNGINEIQALCEKYGIHMRL